MLSLLLLLLSVLLIILLTARFGVHPFLALLCAALFFGICSGMPLPTILEAINDGFGSTLGKIGLVIVLGVLIGAFLEHSGGAFKLAEVVLNLIGRKRVHEAMGIIGYIVSIPVFADSGFIILSPLNKSLTKKAGLSLAGTSVALILGLMLTHVMVPPTPGPIAAAGILNADIGLVMLIGLGVSFSALIVGIIYSKKVAAKVYIDPVPELDQAAIAEKIKQAPNAFQSFLPILVPILLIVGKSIVEFNLAEDTTPSSAVQLIQFVGSPVIALLIGLLLSFLLPKKWDRQLLTTSGLVGKSLSDASTILLITGAGGIFGKILQNSEIAEVLSNSLSGQHLGIWLPFLLAAAIKTAQGSSTVALITTASILAPLAVNLGFESEIQKAMMVVAVGAGSAVISHANDSAFWVMTQLSNMDVRTGYRLYSFGTFIVGTFSAFLLFLLSFLLQ